LVVYTSDVISDHGIMEKGVRFIEKPFSIKELDKSVRDALDQPADKKNIPS